MSLRFRYRLVQMGRMIPSLGGRTVRPRPVIDVMLVGPGGTRVSRALLDTGADDTIFPEHFALPLGLNWTTAAAGTSTHTTTGSIPLRFVALTLRLTDGHAVREWPANVGFTQSPLIYPVLGFAGCLQYFTATFHGDREEVELAVNALYPGT